MGQEEVYLPVSGLDDVFSLLPAGEETSVSPTLVHGHPKAESWPAAQFTPAQRAFPKG